MRRCSCKPPISSAILMLYLDSVLSVCSSKVQGKIELWSPLTAAVQLFVCRVMNTQSCCCASAELEQTEACQINTSSKALCVSHPAQVIDETAPVESLQA